MSEVTTNISYEFYLPIVFMQELEFRQLNDNQRIKEILKLGAGLTY
jgi:hypothetical protein